MLHVFLTILSIFSASFVFAIDQTNLGEKRERFEEQNELSAKKVAIFLLHKACEEGDIEQVKELLKTEDISQKDGNGNTPILAACAHAQADIIKFILLNKEKCININASNKYGNTLLNLACDKFTGEKAEIIKDIIANKQISINQPNKHFNTPLMTACICNNLEAVNILLEHPEIEVNWWDDRGITPLIYACKHDNEKLVETLLQHPKTNVNAEYEVDFFKEFKKNDLFSEKNFSVWEGFSDSIDTRTSLHVSCKHGNEKIVELLLKNNKIDINKRTSKLNNTALTIAINNNKPKIVEMLLKQTRLNLHDDFEFNKYIGILINIAEENKKIDENNELIIKSFIEHKWEQIYNEDKIKLINLCVKYGETDLVNLSVEKRYNEQLENMLNMINSTIESDETQKDNFAIENENLFLLACSKNHKDISEIFIEKFNFNHDLYNKALLELSKCDSEDKNDLTQLLIDNNANVNVPDNDGSTPLHYACQKNNLKLIELLINNNADINLPDNDGSTPLHYACQKYELKLIELLINNNANVNLPDNKGNKPLYYAVNNQSLKAVSMLVENYKDADLLLTDITTQVNGHYILDNALDNYYYVVKNSYYGKEELEKIVELLLEKGAFYKDCYNEQTYTKDLLMEIKTKFLEQNTKNYL